MASSDENSVNRRVRSQRPGAIGVLWRAGLRDNRIPASASEAVRPFLRGLRSTIEREVIPRLVLAHANCVLEPAGTAGNRNMSAADVRDCIECAADCASEQDAPALRICLDRALVWGLPLEQVYIQILGGAACSLGDRWTADKLNIVEVVVAMGVLQAGLREFALDHQHEAAGLASARRIMLLPTPGETHSFGGAVAAEVFRHRGWNVESEFCIEGAEISAILRSEWFDVVGLSLGCDRNLHRLSETIRQIRRHSRNRRVGILVGGPAFVTHPEWLTSCGGDACSTNATNAVEQAGLLVGWLADGRG